MPDSRLVDNDCNNLSTSPTTELVEGNKVYLRNIDVGDTHDNQSDDSDDLYALVSPENLLHDEDSTASNSIYLSAGTATPVNGKLQALDDATDSARFLSIRNNQNRLTGDPESLDLVDRIKGMYRLLNLISEQGSNGLVDKVIIAQESLGRFINDICPGAYRDLTRVDFKAMNMINVKPLGIYGSKEEIIRFLRKLDAIDNVVEALLNAPQDSASGVSRPFLTSGLYALMCKDLGAPECRVYIIFWPEETTWDDNAISTVRRNRITFMRYLTKITDQIAVLISDEHGQALVWDNPQGKDTSAMTFDEDDDTDRLVAFEVSTANEQDEDVKVRLGLEVKHQCISESPASESDSVGGSHPRLIVGETKQAIMATSSYITSSQEKKPFSEFYHNSMQLRSRILASKVTLRLSRRLSDEAIGILMENGLRERHMDAVDAWQKRNDKDQKSLTNELEVKQKKLEEDILTQAEKLKRALRQFLAQVVKGDYPKLEEGRLLESEGEDFSRSLESLDQISYLKNLFALYPSLEQMIRQTCTRFSICELDDNKTFVGMKNTLLICNYIFRHNELSATQREKLWELLKSGDLRRVEVFLSGSIAGDGYLRVFSKYIPLFGPSGKTKQRGGPLKEAYSVARRVGCSEFLDMLDELMVSEPIFRDYAERSLEIAHRYLGSKIKNVMDRLPNEIMNEQLYHCRSALERELDIKKGEARKQSRNRLFVDLDNEFMSDTNCIDVLMLEDLKQEKNIDWSYKGPVTRFRLTGYRHARTQPFMQYTIYPLQLTENDRHRMKIERGFTPKPTIEKRFATGFKLPVDHVVRDIRLLENSRCLLVIDDLRRGLFIYLENMDALEGAIKRGAPRKIINREKTGHDILTAYDERKRMLVVCGVDMQKPAHAIQLHCFVFDEKFTSLQGQGSALNLTPWYNLSDSPKIITILLIPGNDELAVIEASGRVRVFSLIAQTFRPAVLLLPETPMSASSSPDGSCLVATFSQQESFTMRVYHWASLGSHEGFSFVIPSLLDQSPLISSLDDRDNSHLFWIHIKENSCRSIALEITRQVTEFQFRQRNSRSTTRNADRHTTHNSLIDCHSDVWTRFPVIPAVKRQTIVSGEFRKDKHLLFLTSTPSAIQLPDYFSDLIQRFERSTKKPTAAVLSSIRILSDEFSAVVARLEAGNGWTDVSSYKAGEWMVDIFCLIPIHIAIARDNRFIPLKDGVWAPDVEKTLLGADVGQVADSLSFGWYESIFQSYLPTRLVKVVSSMGEQSVGKSFALNHLADTSFAGSAMRTTEGVWMSVTPTDEDLIVALDFEGVHSIERSAQEDTLLVLFNAAISNLVLFRNNFTLSRDITDLFQSFQASASVLDPEANPTLFQSTLVVIIKDVVESDRDEVTREFQIKLQKIVHEEQASNFISRLYRGRLDIVPWPVIESRHFYTLFSALKRRLEKQSQTHESAGIFLHKLKMLMAKLKTNDWGSLSQNMSSHRALHLKSLLSRALMHGATEVEPDIEPLKNFDTNDEVEAVDSAAVFWMDGRDTDSERGKEDTLQGLIRLWSECETRHYRPDSEWVDQLGKFLEDLVKLRIAHVQAWIDSNLAQFSSGNAAIEELHRTFDTRIVELRRCVQLCKIQCQKCYFLCIKHQFHEGEHNCATTHTCVHPCEFLEEHDGLSILCSLASGHEGEHICNTIPHLCGQQCELRDRKGCQGQCTKGVHHELEGDLGHACSAKRHYCGKPCSLAGIMLPNGRSYSCQETCTAVWDEDHELHVCEAVKACPISCQLCGRLCSKPDHLHGLHPDEIHLCGQKHRCTRICESSGVCEIDTVPFSIEETFNGMHDKFQYTKYSQATKRLPCAIPIEAGRLTHDGSHIHTTDTRPFHFCEERCDNCGYLCTLPQGHPQAEHSTNHGSMSRTRWAIDGPDGAELELDGHKFGSSDDGAPMLCNLLCSNMGRHVHIDRCRAGGEECKDPELHHIMHRMHPNPDLPKDWVTHRLFWRRLGFRDPYAREEQANFAKCDAMCSGSEHKASDSGPAQPSYCTLPMFHPAATLSTVPSSDGSGYVSNDGHAFLCKNPAVLQQAFHVIFIIDKSGSMSCTDRRPLPDQPGTAIIQRKADNRLGSVFSALHAFWIARSASVAQGTTTARRDAYSAILFQSTATEVFSNDFSSTPDELLNKVLPYTAYGGTNYTVALRLAEEVMEKNWSTERTPIIIFLSDGECGIQDDVVYDLCRKAVHLGKSLSFHSVSFGRDTASTWLRRMKDIAKEVQSSAPRDPLLPTSAVIESSYNVALDSVKLTETFLGIADSLRKPRGALLRN